MVSIEKHERFSKTNVEMDQDDLNEVSHSLLIGMEDHPCLKVCCKNKNCAIRNLLVNRKTSSGSSKKYDWKKLLTIPILIEGLSEVQARSKRDSEKFKQFEQLRSQYFKSRQVLLQAQNTFKSRQKVEFASLLKFQQKMRSKLVSCRDKAERCERQVKAFIADSDFSLQGSSGGGPKQRDSQVSDESKTDDEKEDLTSTCPDGFEIKEWLKLSPDARLIVLDQFKNAVSLALAKHIPYDSNAKDHKEEDVQDDDDFDDDIALLESEASEIASITKNKKQGGKQNNLAEVVEMNVNNLNRLIRVRYIDSRETAVLDTSKVSMARTSHVGASQGVNKHVVRPLKESDKITTTSIVGIKALEGYGDDDDDDDDDDDVDEESKEGDSKEKSNSSSSSKKKKKKNESAGKLARNVYLIVKTNNELSSVLRTPSGTMDNLEPVTLNVDVLKELQYRKLITAEDFRYVKNQITTSTYLSVDSQLHVGSVVAVDPSTSNADMNLKVSTKEQDIDSKLQSIHEDLNRMDASMTRMETSLDIIEDDDNKNRWCWQRWWGPSALLAHKSRFADENKDHHDDKDKRTEKQKKQERDKSKSIRCFCWGSDEHSQLGEYEDSSKQTQDLRRADVKTSKPKLSSLDRPIAMLVRQIVCSRYQTVILLHEGIVLTTVKISPQEQATLRRKDQKYSRDNDDSKKSGKRYAEFIQIPFPKGMMPVQFIAAGEDHFLALTDDVSNNLYSWGSNKYGQLGLGHTTDMKKPSPVVLPDIHRQGLEKITFASCGTNFSFCVTATNKVYSWGANDKGQLAQWDKKSSMKISPQVCSAWETYREENLPYIEDITINDTSHCPIKDGWKTFRRLLISCGQDHAFSWQTTNDQLKHVHGHVNDESETSQKFQSYEALCPRSQNYSRDMSSMMNSLQKVLSKYELLKVRYKHLKRRAGRWRNHAMHSDKTSSSSSLGSSSQDRVKNALASTVVSHTLENSEFFVHQKNSLNEIRKKRRATREKLGMLEKERAKLKSSINLCQRQLDTQNYNLNALSSAIESGKVKIENYKAQIQELKTQSNESAVSGVKNTLKIENQIKRLQEAKEKASREFDVNVELHKFGKVSLNTKKLNKLQRQLEDMERKIDYETDKFHMYTKESEALKDSLTDVMKQAKLNVFAHESSLSKKGAATSSSSSSSSSNKGSSQLDSILQTAVRLKTRLDRASIQVICKQRISLDDPSKIAQAMIERTETEILRELNSVDGDLMGDVKHLLRSVLLQNCHLRRQANGMRQASDKVNMATKQKKDVDDTKVLFDSDSGSDEYISAGPE